MEHNLGKKFEMLYRKAEVTMLRQKGDTNRQSGRYSQVRVTAVLLQKKKKKAIPILCHVWESSLQSAGSNPATVWQWQSSSWNTASILGHQIWKKEMNCLKKPRERKDHRSRKHDLWRKTERTGTDQAKLQKIESGHNNSFYKAIIKKQGTVCSVCLQWMRTKGLALQQKNLAKNLKKLFLF